MFLDCSFTYVNMAFMLFIRVADYYDFFRTGGPFLVAYGAPLGDRTSWALASFFLKKVLGLDSGFTSFGLRVAAGSFGLVVLSTLLRFVLERVLAGSYFIEAVCLLYSGRL